jgi:hypothetical protein
VNNRPLRSFGSVPSRILPEGREVGKNCAPIWQLSLGPIRVDVPAMATPFVEGTDSVVIYLHFHRSAPRSSTIPTPHDKLPILKAALNFVRSDYIFAALNAPTTSGSNTPPPHFLTTHTY